MRCQGQARPIQGHEALTFADAVSFWVWLGLFLNQNRLRDQSLQRDAVQLSDVHSNLGTGPKITPFYVQNMIYGQQLLRASHCFISGILGVPLCCLKFFFRLALATKQANVSLEREEM
jgi:hypothetical protein